LKACGEGRVWSGRIRGCAGCLKDH